MGNLAIVLAIYRRVHLRTPGPTIPLALKKTHIPGAFSRSSAIKCTPK